MEIKIGKYTLCSDQWSMWIEEEYSYEGKGGKKKNGTRRVAGYCGDFRQLMRSYCQHKYRGDGAKEMREALNVLADTEKDVMEFIDKSCKKKFRLEEK